jgi:hypothetical protein
MTPSSASHMPRKSAYIEDDHTTSPTFARQKEEDDVRRKDIGRKQLNWLLVAMVLCTLCAAAIFLTPEIGRFKSGISSVSLALLAVIATIVSKR